MCEEDTKLVISDIFTELGALRGPGSSELGTIVSYLLETPTTGRSDGISGGVSFRAQLGGRIGIRGDVGRILEAEDGGHITRAVRA